jgi:hypothetical protein
MHYCWFGGNPMPDKYKKYMESRRKFCPRYELIEWNESNYDVTKNNYMHEAYKAKKWEFVSDYARLDIIYNHGGVYFDTDVELIKSIDELLKGEAFMGFTDRRHVATGLGFGAVKGHKTVKELRDYYEKLTFIKGDGTYNTTPCTTYQTACLLKKGLKRNNQKQTVAGITIYPHEYFDPKSYTTFKTKITPNTHSIHHYSLSWFSAHDKKKFDFRMKWGERLGGSFFAYRLSAGFAKLFIRREE